MKKTIAALLVFLSILCCAAVASAGVSGHFVSEAGGTYVIILSQAINPILGGVYIGNSHFKYSLSREEQKDGSIRVYTPLDVSDTIIDLRLRYADDTQQVALATGDIKRFNGDGTLMEDQSILGMQDVRFIRQEVPSVSGLKGTRWKRYSMTLSGNARTYPFDGSVIEFYDTQENAGRIPDNAERTYPFTYEVSGDSLLVKVEAGGGVTEATVRIDSDVLIVTIENSTLYFLPESL